MVNPVPMPADPTRSLALLWRRAERATRRGNDLSVDRIVTAAVELADADGLAAVTMRSVAARLEVGTMSLYTHVPGKPELEVLMLDRACGEGTDEPDAPAWRARLERVAHRDWDRYHRHPWLLEVATRRPPFGPNVVAKYQQDLRAMDGTTLTPAERNAVLMTLASYVHGAARASVEAARTERESGITEREWWAAHRPYVEWAEDPSGTGDREADHWFAFEFGLARILDGLDAFVGRTG
ncbi:TetR/AcrR family transcriptional regulator [Phytohabitans houttuyneae]|uniref:TetR family transcriptional regulator n=2 Tax=Phytohabitans houttuyneae TaxID=1076126 RepID=A0A6V8KME6_9ACTN|nr:TetR family transcriptional regulator [Phytohabitans houttuyneae]